MRSSVGGRKAPLIEVLVASSLWRAKPRAAGIVRKAVLTAARALSTSHIELAIVLADDSAIRTLNRDWRKRDAPTNVLAFPTKGAAADRRTPWLLGDIVIAYETTAREAVAQGKLLEHHLAHLAVHGFLHLLGYDHNTTRAAKKMEQLEVAILKRLAVPDPHAARSVE